ncbi:MAG: ABC transporter ATP-binding protein [Acuticoccus sp.]
MSAPLLSIDHLEVVFATRGGLVEAVRGVSFAIERGETLGLVGESGSGKSVTAQAVMGLIDPPGEILAGDIRWEGRSLPAEPRRWAKLRGREIAMVFQDPMTSLNPLMTVGDQITETLRRHMGFSRRAAPRRAAELLGHVGISMPEKRLDQRPHEFSGGMRQRVMIAMALACEPKLLIADEPTTALDVTVQAQIIDLLADLQVELGLAILLITHDLGVVAGICRNVAVMYAGRVVETGPADALFKAPAHPYTQGLLRSTPSLDASEHRLVAIPGAPPRLVDPPRGCAFLPRCPIGETRCERLPPLATTGESRRAACFRAGIDAWRTTA